MKSKFSFENVNTSPFFSFISPSGIRCAFYICLIFGVVIFDELWVAMDIDIRVNTVHGPVFDDVEVSPAALLTYSEHMFADIHGNVSGDHYDVNVLCFGEREIMPDKLRKVLLPFLADWRQCLLAQCDPDTGFFIGLGILNWWVLSLSWTFGINFDVRICFALWKQIYLNACGLMSDQITREMICWFIPLRYVY